MEKIEARIEYVSAGNRSRLKIKCTRPNLSVNIHHFIRWDREKNPLNCCGLTAEHINMVLLKIFITLFLCWLYFSSFTRPPEYVFRTQLCMTVSIFVFEQLYNNTVDGAVSVSIQLYFSWNRIVAAALQIAYYYFAHEFATVCCLQLSCFIFVVVVSHSLH